MLTGAFAVHPDTEKSGSKEIVEQGNDTSHGKKQILEHSIHQQLQNKRTHIQQLLLIAREITRRKKLRTSKTAKHDSAYTHDQYLLDVLRERVRTLALEINQLEQTSSADKTKQPAYSTQQPSLEQRNLGRLVEELDTRTLHPSSEIKTFAWPVEGEILSSPGDSLRRGGARWPGIFIKSKPGAQVRAIASGRVVYAGEMRHLGLLVVLDHQDGHLSMYGRNNEIFVKTDQIIDESELIGTIADGSDAGNSEFYFEIRRDGTPIDPRQVCEK